MADDKNFITYNQQMRKLRNDKHINCSGSKDKRILIRMGYFNIVNGYKSPFTCGTDITGAHVYLPDTSLEHLYNLKKFDDELRLFLLKYITQIEEEVRTLTGYKFDQCNNDGKIPWYDANGKPNIKLLIGSLHWMRKIRNSCAHNERIFCMHQSQNSLQRNSGRIIEKYIMALRPSYSKNSDKRIFDLLIYFKYYLPDKEFQNMIEEFQKMLTNLQNSIPANAFDNIRGQMGIKSLSDLEALKSLYKTPILYNNFDIST